MSDHGAVVRLPPVSGEESSHHPVAASAVPDEDAAGPKHAGHFADDCRVVARIEEETEGREQIDDRVKAASPSGWHLPHIAASVAKGRTRPALARDRQQVGGVIEAV